MRIGEICEFVYGDSLPKQNRIKGNIPVYGSNGKIDFHNESITKGETIIVGRKGSIGEVHISKTGCWIIDTAYYIKPLIEINIQYLYLLLKTLNLSKLNKASSIPGLNRDDVYKIDINLPTIEEQERIVKIIERKLTAVEKAKKASDEQLSVIKKLFNSYIVKIYENENRNIVKLGDIGDVSMCKRIFKEQTQQKGDIPFYKIGTFGKKADAYISQSIFTEYKEKYPFPQKGDVLISAAGTIGKAVIYDGEQAYYQDSNIVWINNDEKQVLNKYLYFYYLTQPWQPTSGSIVTRLYNDDILKTNIPITSIDEQKSMISLLELKFNAVEKLKNKTNDQSSYINTLPSSILRKAFNGDY